jgi:hypothetical protein
VVIESDHGHLGVFVQGHCLEMLQVVLAVMGSVIPDWDALVSEGPVSLHPICASGSHNPARVKMEHFLVEVMAVGLEACLVMDLALATSHSATAHD